MARNVPAPLRELRDWLRQSVADAQAILPDLLDLSLPAFHLRLSVRPQLRTAGMMQCLLDLAEQALGRFRRHAYDLTSIAVEIVDELVLPPHEQHIVQRLRGQAWKTHARALLGIDKPQAARDAIARARAAFGTVRGNEWYLATIDSVEARILCSLGRHREALPLVQRAVPVLLASADYEECIEAVVTNTLILRELGDEADLSPLLFDIADLSGAVGDSNFLAQFMYRGGLFDLRHGSARSAWDRLSSACDSFRRLGRTAEAIAAHRAMAEAALRLKRPNDAISEQYKAYGALLGIGQIDDAAVVGAQIVALLLRSGRIQEARSLAVKLPAALESGGLRASALQALRWLSSRAGSVGLHADDAVAVGLYFDDLFLRPNAAFEPPDPAHPVRGIVTGATFEADVASLGPAGHLYVRMLVSRIAAAPERHPVAAGKWRVFRTWAYARFPALRIFYTYDESAVCLLSVEPRDELAE